ncbi:MAG: tryptophan 7-halogenase [Gammaproteobacteria bacterium]|nr:tryptophan 7-halogenase [Gammaproteobacteria bacterium]
MPQPLVLIGQGLWLQMATAIVARHLQPFGYQCVALELPAVIKEPSAVACGPELATLCKMLDLPLQQLLQNAKGTFSLGSQYQSGENSWFVPFGHYGLNGAAAEFDQAILQLLQQDPDSKAEQFSIAASAARQGKFALAPANRPDLSSALSYGVHLHTEEFTACLKHFNLQHGVTFLSSQTLEIQHNTEGQISSLQLDQGTTIPVGHCLDCRAEPTTGVTSRTVQFFSAQDTTELLQQPYSSVIQTSWGWLVRLPLQQGSHWFTQCTDPAVDLPQIRQELQQLTGQTDWQHCSRQQPTESQPWQHNHLRFGQAAAALDCPLYNGLTALQYLVIRWLDLLPNQSSCPATALMYNQHWQQYQSEVQDFLQLHQQPLATKTGQAFARLGRAPNTETDAIKAGQWFGLMQGLGLKPELSSMLLANRTETEIHQGLRLVQQQIARLIAAMPSQADTLNRCLQQLEH